VDATVYVAVISGLAAVVSAVYTARSAGRTTQKKTEADEHVALRQVEAGAYDRARQFYEATLTRMQAEIDRQSGQINTLQRQVSRLSRQIRDNGLVPVSSSEEEGL
jgi:SMC interacting uncharacterized protein involved in chromosome segregation